MARREKFRWGATGVAALFVPFPHAVDDHQSTNAEFLASQNAAVLVQLRLVGKRLDEVKLVTYVPDKVITPLIKNLHADPDFLTFPTAREEEALGIVSGAWMGGRRGAVLMQTSGFGTIPNVLASLVVPYQVPAIMFVSERGTLGEFNLGQALVCRTMRPVLESLAVESHTITRHDELEVIVDRSIKQAVATQAAVAFILSPLLTGGKVFEA